MLVINKEDTELNYKISGQLLGSFLDLISSLNTSTTLSELTYKIGYIKGLTYNQRQYDKI